MRMRRATAAATTRMPAAAAVAGEIGGGTLRGTQGVLARVTGTGSAPGTAGRAAEASGPGARATLRTCALGARKCGSPPAACPGGAALLQLMDEGTSTRLS